jgi:hypothetical protein
MHSRVLLVCIQPGNLNTIKFEIGTNLKFVNRFEIEIQIGKEKKKMARLVLGLISSILA